MIYLYELKICSKNIETFLSFPIFFIEVKALIKNNALGFTLEDKYIAVLVPNDLPHTKI